MKFNLFAYGFRPGFLICRHRSRIVSAPLAMSFVSGTSLGSTWPPTLDQAMKCYSASWEARSLDSC